MEREDLERRLCLWSRRVQENLKLLDDHRFAGDERGDVTQGDVTQLSLKKNESPKRSYSPMPGPSARPVRPPAHARTCARAQQAARRRGAPAAMRPSRRDSLCPRMLALAAGSPAPRARAHLPPLPLTCRPAPPRRPRRDGAATCHVPAAAQAASRRLAGACARQPPRLRPSFGGPRQGGGGAGAARSVSQRSGGSHCLVTETMLAPAVACCFCQQWPAGECAVRGSSCAL